MFKLDDAIAGWRRQLVKGGLRDLEILDELESHLREEIEARMCSGATGPQQAFEASVERIGRTQALNGEFAKVGHSPEQGKLWDRLVVGCMAAYSLMTGAFVLFKVGSLSDVSFGQQMLALSAVGTTALLLFVGRLSRGLFPVIPNKQVRVSIYIVGAGLLMLWLFAFFQLVMTRFELDMSALVVALIWAWAPMGALCGIIYGFEAAAINERVAEA